MNIIIKKILTEISYYTGKYCLPPEYLSLMVTYQCNFRCHACHAWKKKAVAELDGKSWSKLIKDLTTIFPKETFVEISGGEPLLKKNITLPMVHNLKTHFQKVTLNSNGSLINATTIKDLEKARLDCLKISLYSLNKKTHNKLRGTGIAYNHALQAIDLIKKSKIKLEIGVLITSENIAGIPKLLEKFSDYPNIEVILQPLDQIFHPINYENKKNILTYKNLCPSKKQIKIFFDKLEQRKLKVKNSSGHLKIIKQYYLNPSTALRYRCFAGQRYLVVYPNGEVGFCYRKKPIGNLKNFSISKILKEKATQRRGEIRDCRAYCRVLGCLFSRGFSEIIQEKLFKI